MGFLKDVVIDVAKEVAAEVSDHPFSSAIGAISDASVIADEIKRIGDASERIAIRKANKLDAYQEKMEKLHPANRHIWLMEESKETKASLLGSSTLTEYNFFDVYGNTRYTASSKQIRKNNEITLYDSAGDIIGSITELKSKQKNPFAAKNNEKLIELAMYFRDEPVGFVTNAVWKGKWFLTWDVVNWGAVRKKVGINQIVTEDEKLIAEITTKKFNSRKLTFLDIEDAEKEKAVALFALAIIAYGNSK